MADLDDDPFNVANDFLDRHSPPGKEERNATLRELIAEISQPLWRAAANARLDELEAAQSATAKLEMPRMDEILLACGEMTASERRCVRTALEWFIRRVDRTAKQEGE